MNENQTIPEALEPAITPAFLATLDLIDLQPNGAERAGPSWAALLFSAMSECASRLTPQLVCVSPAH
jgi:hypothetical protein